MTKIPSKCARTWTSFYFRKLNAASSNVNHLLSDNYPRGSSYKFNNNYYCGLSHVTNNKNEFSDLEKKIMTNTEISRDHLTPELRRLHLITDRCQQWRAREDELVFSDPYWAFYWPGGQVLTRYLLDTRLAEGTRVLDVGSGCGASAIAAAMTRAEHVVANDIDEVALQSISLNARLNHVTVHLNSRNLIGHDLRHTHSGLTGLDQSTDTGLDQSTDTGLDQSTDTGLDQSTDTGHGQSTDTKLFQGRNIELVQSTDTGLDQSTDTGPSNKRPYFDTVLIGDMFYDEDMTRLILTWMEEISPDCRILLGEPGRSYFVSGVRNRFTKIGEYELTHQARRENNGLTSAGVYEYVRQ